MNGTYASQENTCHEYLKVLGGEVYEFDRNRDQSIISDTGILVFSLQKLTSLLMIAVYIVILLRARRRTGSIRKLYSQLKSASIFEFMKDIKTSRNPEMGNNSEKNLFAKSLKRRDKETVHLLCDFSACCCDCCCQSWLSFYQKYILQKCEMLYAFFENYLMTHGSIFFVVCVLIPFVYIPATFLFPFFFVNSCFGNTDFTRGIYRVIDFFCGTLQFFNYVFIISFLGTKGEMMAIKKKSADQRGLLVYYHCKKALAFAFFHLVLKVLVLIFIGDTIYELSVSVDTDLFWIMKAMFLILFSNYNHAKETIPISENDLVIKSQRRLFAYQNSLLKYVPGPASVWRNLQKIILTKLPKTKNSILEEDFSKFFQPEFSEAIRTECMRADYLLITELKVVEFQQFKNIQTNTGSNPYYPSALLHYLLFIDIPLNLICNILCLFDYTLDFSYWLCYFMYDLEALLFPWLNFMTLKRNILFGEEEEDLVLKESQILPSKIEVESEMSLKM